MKDVRYRKITLPSDIDRRIHELVLHYKLRFAAIDMATTVDGRWIFFEVNPNGQWAWLDMKAGADIATGFVHSFSER